MSILLLHPPVSKPCEPPAGIAKLRAALIAHGINCTSVDLNLEGISWLLHHPPAAEDRWSRRAVRQTAFHLSSLKSWDLYRNLDRYKRAVFDLSRVLQLSGTASGARLNLSNYQHDVLSPLRSADLFKAAEHPEANPFYPFFSARISSLLEETGSDTVGISLNFLHQALNVFAILGFLRREFPRLRVVLGGGLITSWLSHSPGHNPFHPLADHVVRGPGEASLLTFLGCPSADASPRTPDYNGLPVREYLSPSVVLPYSASSGCYWSQCAFCPERTEGNPYVPVPPTRVIEDLRELSRELKPGLVHFLDNALSPSLLKALAEDPPGVPWYGFARMDANLGDPHFCQALKRSGCVMLKLGLESGDQKVMEGERKGTSVALASQVLRNLKSAGIATYAYLLFGTPSETEREAIQTLNFVVEHGDCIDFMNVALFNMPLQGPRADGLVRHAHYEGDLSLYTGFSHPKGWDRGRVRHFLERVLRKDRRIAAILRNEPPFFTSNHAPFFRYNSTPSRE